MKEVGVAVHVNFQSLFCPDFLRLFLYWSNLDLLYYFPYRNSEKIVDYHKLNLSIKFRKCESGFEPEPQDGRRRRIEWDVKSCPSRISLSHLIFLFQGTGKTKFGPSTADHSTGSLEQSNWAACAPNFLFALDAIKSGKIGKVSCAADSERQKYEKAR